MPVVAGPETVQSHRCVHRRRRQKRGLKPQPPADRRSLAPRLSRLDRPAADARGACSVPRRPVRRTPTRRWSTGCWPARSTASAGAGTGWTSGATATGGAWAPRSATARSTSGTGATGSSSRSTPTRATTRWSARCSRPTSCIPNDLDRLRATGFLARQYFKFNRNTWLDETVEHTGKAFLGLTLNCAKCHDHKYDPIAQVDYYRFRAFFEPYQVRTDQVPGETDFEKDGIPRVFDCNLDGPDLRCSSAATSGSRRKKRPLTPACRCLLPWQPLEIRQRDAARRGTRPGLRPFVLDNHLRPGREQQIAGCPRGALQQ